VQSNLFHIDTPAVAEFSNPSSALEHLSFSFPHATSSPVVSTTSEPGEPEKSSNADIPLLPKAETLVLIADAAARHNVPAAFVQSIVAAESNFNCGAISPKGAIGLMQLMPETAQQFGADPKVPAQNIDAGKSPAQIFGDTCAGCHKNARELRRVGPHGRGAPFPGVRHLEFCRERGYVLTLFGRKCQYPDIKNSNPSIRAFNERAAINARLQGSAADIIRRAMIRVEPELELARLKAQMLLQVHDELIFEVPEAEVKDTITIVKSVMQDAPHPSVSLHVPLQVDARAADNWDEAH
jgi:hypothetical protein